MFDCRFHAFVMSNSAASISNGSANSLFLYLKCSQDSLHHSTLHSSSPTNRRAGRCLAIRYSARHRSHSCPAAFERLPGLGSEVFRFPPHFEDYLQAALSGGQPEDRLCSPENGVMIFVDFSFSTTQNLSIKKCPRLIRVV